eukprot:Seg741.4 transcript_id=Seg741.4/GoldUCD/mRNA.D3Y31 product="hypothetical protein" protein_id=Seg741.4/GoldUCD/D3Y31
MNGKCLEKSLVGSDNGLTLLKYGLLVRKKEQQQVEIKKKDEKISKLQETIFKLQDVTKENENQLRDMKESQMNHQTPRVQDLIAENKMMHENARTLMLEKEELANECQGKTMKLNEQSRLLDIKEKKIQELECEKQNISKSMSCLEELSENTKQIFDKNEKENEEIENELYKLKGFVHKVQMIVNVAEMPNDQSCSDDGLKIGPKDFHDVAIAVSKVVDERDHLRKENEELRERLKVDEHKEHAEMLEEKNSVFQQKIKELEKNVEVLKSSINARETERADLQKKFDDMKIFVEEEKNVIVKLEEKLEEITAEKDGIGKQLEDLMQTCHDLNSKLDEELILRGKATERLEEIIAEKDDIGNQLDEMAQKCDGLNAKLDEETILRRKINERLEKITAERNEVITNLAEGMKVKRQVEKSLDEITTEKNQLVVEKIQLYKNYINEKNKRFEIEDELTKSRDLIEELHVPKLNCLQALIPCCFRRRR